MKLRTILIAAGASALALLGPATIAQNAPAPAAKAEPAPPAPIAAKPALWKVSDKDTTIYLFGTVHLLPKGIEWYNGKLQTAFESSQELVTEIPEVSDGESISMMLKHGTLPPGQTLRADMTAEEKTKFEAAMASLGLPTGAFDRYKPWFAAVALATLPLQKSGYSIDSGVENQLSKRNKELGRPRTGLETLDFQLGIFNGLAPDKQKRYLFEVIDGIPEIKPQIDKMVAAWAKGDANALAALMNAETDDPALWEALLTNRNRNWAVWIDNRLDQPGVVFVAVGAGHLGGKDSVQQFLAKSKIKAVRVQ